MRRACVVLLLAVSLLAGCGEEQDAPRPVDQQDVVRQVVWATERAGIDRETDFEGSKRVAAPVRAAAQRCLRGWRASPYELRDDLYAVYEIALARPSAPTVLAAARRWRAALLRIDGLPDGPLAPLPAVIDRAVAGYAALLGPAVEPCAIIRRWQASGWNTRPTALRALERRRAQWQAVRTRDARVLSRFAYAVRRVAGDAASSVSDTVELNPLPLADGFDRCTDPVFDVLAPEDGFCG